MHGGLNIQGALRPGTRPHAGRVGKGPGGGRPPLLHIARSGGPGVSPTEIFFDTETTVGAFLRIHRQKY